MSRLYSEAAIVDAFSYGESRQRVIVSAISKFTEPYPRSLLPFEVRWPLVNWIQYEVTPNSVGFYVPVPLTAEGGIDALATFMSPEGGQYFHFKISQPLLGSVSPTGTWTWPEPTPPPDTVLEMTYDSLVEQTLVKQRRPLPQNKKRQSGTWKTWHHVRNRLNLRVPHR